MNELTDDLRILGLRPLISPAILMETTNASDASFAQVARHRGEVVNVLNSADDRLLVVVGPCSIHDTDAALDYAGRLKERAAALSTNLLVVMRTYFEKPRTTVGWKGLINDPHLNESFLINEGLRRARKLLVDLAELGIPAGTEFLDPITPQFVADLVTWGAIGARTSESQVHRELASGLSMPVGFKNGTGGSVRIAIDAIRSAAHPHHFLSVTKQGLAAIVATAGNPDCHIILRGGSKGPNYDRESVAGVVSELEQSRLRPRLMIDCSHANSDKDPARQPVVARAIGEQVATDDTIFGVMLESFLLSGRQDYVSAEACQYGQSITDGCLSWEQTLPVLDDLAESVEKRRARKRG